MSVTFGEAIAPAGDASVVRYDFSVSRMARERLIGQRGVTVWLTGLSGAGKSTLANALSLKLHEVGILSYVLDGDNLRTGLCHQLGFSPQDRLENIRRIAEVAGLMIDAGVVVLASAISPFAADRGMARRIVGSERFLEVYVDTPLDICERRDPKGLYRRARNGLVQQMTGIDSPYEAPEAPDYIAHCGNRVVDAIVEELMTRVVRMSRLGIR